MKNALDFPFLMGLNILIILQENVDMITYLKNPGALQIYLGIGVTQIVHMTMVNRFSNHFFEFPAFF